MLSRTIYKDRRRRRWLTALATLSLVTATFVGAGPVAGFTQNEFELDKNATNDLTTVHLGVLKNSLNATATSTIVCERAGIVYPSAPFTILIDGEQMTVTSFGATTTTTGGCSFSDPAIVKTGTRVYNLTRHVNGTTAASHPGSSDVTQMVTGATAGDDWDQVYSIVQADLAQNPPVTVHTCAAIGATACDYLHDGFGVSVFTTGGSKDDLNVNPLAGESGTGWKWTDSSVPPADEILDAFAAKYDDGLRQLLFFGADRYATNGAKDMGFWFFHDEVSLNANGTFNGNHTRPTAGPDGIPGNGDDTRGDILLLSTFTQGGAVTSIRVFEWVGTGGNTNGTLNSIGAFGDCVPGNVLDNGCNTVSDTTVPSPWPYQGSGSTNVSGFLYAGALAEGGIDLTALGLEGCFATFSAETRSSPEPGAQLKDFALGTFESCGATITTDASDDEFEIGGSISDTATVNITGGGPAPTGFVNFYVCGPSDGIASCDATGTPAGHINLNTAVVSGTDYTVTSDTVTPTAAGDYCFYAEYPAGQDTNYPDGAVLTDFTDECFTVTPKQPGILTQVNTEDPVPPGTEIFDTATLSNTATPSNGLNGTITFTAYGPHANATTCTTVAYTSTVAVTGDGSYASNTPPNLAFTPTTPGNYNWIAVYAPDAGDVNNLTASTACGDAHEGSVVEQFQPTQTTAQTWTVFDSMTVNVAGGGDLLGTAHFALHRTADCSDAAFFTDDVDVAGPSGTTVSTAVTVDTTFITDEPTLYWNVSYTSTNPSHADIPASCTENSVLDINN